MILCKDCVYISSNWRYKEKALCRHESSIKGIDPVDGQEYYLTCYEARDSDSICGEEACLFVPKKR